LENLAKLFKHKLYRKNMERIPKEIRQALEGHKIRTVYFGKEYQDFIHINAFQKAYPFFKDVNELEKALQDTMLNGKNAKAVVRDFPNGESHNYQLVLHYLKNKDGDIIYPIRFVPEE